MGPSGSGKSRLALGLLQAAGRGALSFARLIADDRTELEAAHGRLLVRPPPALAGLIEIRGVGIGRVPYEPVGVVGLVVELGAADAARLPEPDRQIVELHRVRLPRLAVAVHQDPLPMVLGRLWTAASPA